MKKNLSYAIVTPNTISKSRTGGVIARLLSRSDLELVGAQIFTPDESFVREYAESIRSQEARNLNTAGGLLADYIERNLAPSGGRPHRMLLLIFRGDDACVKLSQICGPIFPKTKPFDQPNGETIRDTYGDLIRDPDDPEKIVYFEPAVLTPRLQELAHENLALFVRHFQNSENIVHTMIYPDPSRVEQTLVIIKPDNWNYASGRPGTIIDMFSRTGLRIVGIKIFCFSLNQAMDFYGPVESALMQKLAPMFGQKAKELLEREFAFHLTSEAAKTVSDCFGRGYAENQFLRIVEFMSGRRPETCPPGEADVQGKVKCMILIYEGVDSVKKIRDVLGPTDPLKAPGGTVRREFGSNIMVNTAHASDSVESCEREKKIVRIHENSLIKIIEEYLAEKDQ